MHYFTTILMIFLTVLGLLLGQGKEYGGPKILLEILLLNEKAT